MKNYCLLLLCSVFMLLSQGCREQAKSPAKATLTFNFQPNSVYEYDVDSRQTMRQHLMDLSIELQQQFRTQSSYMLLKDDSGRKSVEAEYEWIYIKSVNNDLTLEYDSRDTAKQARELSGLGDMAGRPFVFTVDKTGAMIGLNGLSGPRAGNASGKSQGPVIKGQLNDSTVRTMMQQLLNVYPGGEVSPGASWERKYPTSVGFIGMEMDSRFRLLSVQGNLARVEVISSMKSVPSSNPQMKGMSVDMKGQQTGLLSIDVNSGLITSGALRQQITGTMKVGATEIPADLTSTIQITGRKR